MQKKLNVPNYQNGIFSKYDKLFLFGILLVIFMWLGVKNITFFHTTIELAGVIIGACIFIFSMYSYNLSTNKIFQIIGATYIYIVLFEFLQSLFAADSQYSFQLAFCSRFFQCIFLCSFFSSKLTNKINVKLLFYCCLASATVLLYCIFSSHIFPICRHDNGTFSLFFKSMYYFTAALLIVTTYISFRKKEMVESALNKQLLAYCLLGLAYQSILLINIHNDNLHIIIIHIIKLLTNYPIFIMLTRLALKKPLTGYFDELILKSNELTKKEHLLEKQNKELILKNKALIDANTLILSSQKKYEKLLKFLPDAVVLLRGNKIMFVNNKFNEMFKLPINQNLLNSNIFKLAPESCKSLLAKKLQYVYQGNNIQSMEIKLELTPNNVIDLEYSILYNVIDDEKHALIIFKNITEKKKAQEILNRAKIDEENEKIKIGFLANVSHELRTPINLIYSALQLQEQYQNIGKEAYSNKYNKVIKQNCYRLLRTINNLIDATKIDASFFKSNMRYMNIVSVIEESTLSVVSYIESKSMSLVFDTDIEEKYMLCDPDLIERIVLNLLANSVKYGVYEGKISVTIEDHDEFLKIYFKDNGIGIPKDKRDILFNRFVQVDKSFSRNAEGSGIGLFLVKKFVEMHDGTIDMDSEEGNGVEICITLPCYIEDEISPIEFKDSSNDTSIIDKVNIEFSDVYI